MTKHMIEAEILEQKHAIDSVVIMRMHAPEIAAEAEPGQFVNVQVAEGTAPLLRRPFGVAAVDKAAGTIDIIYRIIGEATQILEKRKAGEKLSVIGPLGHGFDLKAEKMLLVGGGLGLAPLLYLADYGKKAKAVGESGKVKGDGAEKNAGGFAKKLCDEVGGEVKENSGKEDGGTVDVLMGGRCCEELFWQDLYKDCSDNIYLTCDDGSVGTEGTVMALLPELLKKKSYDCVYVCGPVPMMKAVAEAADAAGVKCQVSLEKYMGCGLGACLSCSCGGIGKRLKVCTDGPVFWSTEVGEW